MILREVKLCTVSYFAESRSAQYHTAGGKFRAVSYWAELSPQILLSDSAQYDTAQNLTLRSTVWYWAELRKIRITRRKRNQKRKYFNPLVSGSDRLEWWKKNGGRKSCWTVPLNLFCTVVYLWRLLISSMSKISYHVKVYTMVSISVLFVSSGLNLIFLHASTVDFTLHRLLLFLRLSFPCVVVVGHYYNVKCCAL